MSKGKGRKRIDGPLKLMVASTVYGFRTELTQICTVLQGFGYEVWNSDWGPFPPLDPSKSNLENCVAAAEKCDLFLGIIRPFYGSGIIGDRSITHNEMLTAISAKKPRWFLAHRDVVFARQILKQFRNLNSGFPNPDFEFKKTNVMDDVRVIDMYEDVIQNAVPVQDRRGHWAQEFYTFEDALRYIEGQFKDIGQIRGILDQINHP